MGDSKSYFKRKRQVKIKNILVTGGSGFVGTNLLIKLSKNKNFILYSNNFSNINFKRVTGVNYVQCNLENLKECKKICKNIDVVIMCAANSSGAAMIEKTPLVHLSPNIRMNINMAEAAYEANVQKFIFISSNTVYPYVDFAVKEKDASFDFFEKYFVVGWMKRFSEVVMEIYSKRIKLNKMVTIVVRPGNLYGPYDKFDPQKSKVIPSLIKKIVEKKNPITVWGNGEDLKDFLYIDDFIDALITIINKINEYNIFNIASGKSIKIIEILNTILKIEKIKNLKIKFDKTMPTMVPKRFIDITKSKKYLNFNPKVSLKEGLQKTISWYKSNHNKISL
jgi:GDP-L-fucose synthase